MTNANKQTVQDIFDRLCQSARANADYTQQTFAKSAIDDGYQLIMSDDDGNEIDISHTWGTCYSMVRFETFDVRITINGEHSGFLAFDPDKKTDWDKVGEECFRLLQSLFAVAAEKELAAREEALEAESTRRTDREINSGFVREHMNAWGMN